MLRRRRRRIRLILLEVVGVSVMNHRPLGRCILNGRRRIGVLDSVEHAIKEMRSNHDMAGPDLRHGLLWRILAFDVLPFGLFRFCPVSHQDAVAQPFFLRSFERREKYRTVKTKPVSFPAAYSNSDSTSEYLSAID